MRRATEPSEALLYMIQEKIEEAGGLALVDSKIRLLTYRFGKEVFQASITLSYNGAEVKRRKAKEEYDYLFSGSAADIRAWIMSNQAVLDLV